MEQSRIVAMNLKILSTPLTSTRHEEKRPLLENAKTCYGQTYELGDGPITIRACLVLTDRGDKYIKHYTIN